MELTFETLLCARTCFKPIIIYIAKHSILTLLSGGHYLSPRTEGIGSQKQ